MQTEPTPKLQGGFSPLGMWAFSIGTSIGWGSFIVTCNAYLKTSGVLGTLFGMLVGLAVILVVTWNLQYMIRNCQSAGGIYTFARETCGRDLGFLAGWFVLLTYFAILWANITSVPLFARFFFGDAFQFGHHYTVFGYEVWFGEGLLSMAAVALIGLLCARGSRHINRIMITSALVFSAGFTICALAAIFLHGRAFSYSPLYLEGAMPFSQIVHIAAISPWAFIGFENVSHFSEEYDFPVKKVRSVLIWSVVFATAFYILVSLLSVSAYPPEYKSWIDYIRDMGNLSGIKAVPAFYAAHHYMGGLGVSILLLSLLGVILTSLIGNLLALSRLIYAVGREGDAPACFKRLSRDGIPVQAILFIVLVSLAIPFLGRTAIGWIVDVTTLGASMIYAIICFCVYRHARSAGATLEMFTSRLGFAIMALFLVLLLIPGLMPFHAMATESYALFIVWAILGLFYFRRLVRRDRYRAHGKTYLVWVILLMLVLFASMMWVSRSTEKVAEEAVERIFVYHESHSTDDSIPKVREERTKFLHQQAKEIGDSNTTHSFVSLGLFFLALMIIFNNYRDTRELGERLSEAEERARQAKRIADLRASFSSLLKNMPGMNFAKDAKTGVYVACNQAFAEYAHKQSPAGVIGHTDAEIFDPETAAKFVRDDEKALSMSEPFVFTEDVLDAQGNPKQFQTTKLKYVDDTGRLCTLGMSLDITELVAMRKENIETRAAYEKEKSTSAIYSHISQALALSYTVLYYVNTETDEFIEYRNENGVLKQHRAGTDFFKECMEEIPKQVHPDDRNSMRQALDKDNLMRELDRNSVFIITHRVITDAGERYVTMKLSRMRDDPRFIVAGTTDTDEQLRQRWDEELVRKERIAFNRLQTLTRDFLCVYIVDLATGQYREHSSTEQFRTFGMAPEGEDFFADTMKNIRQVLHPDDLSRFESTFTRENIIDEIERSGSFVISYRLMLGGEPHYVQLKASILEEDGSKRLVIGVSDIDTYVRQEEAHARRLSQAINKASVDALTGVKNKHAYDMAVQLMDKKIAERSNPPFAVTILDVNDLKRVNDTQGHQAGDQYLIDACRLICKTFKHSPVFRVGGDEFAVISQGDDLEHIEELLAAMEKHNREALHGHGIVIACGMARFDHDDCVAPVFQRADQKMYRNKDKLKHIES